MRILMTGATGLIGRELGKALVARGDTLVCLVRDLAAARGRLPFPAECHAWDHTQAVPAEALRGVDAVVNLAGEPVADTRWTAAKKALIRDSRVLGTQQLVRAVLQAAARLDWQPAVDALRHTHRLFVIGRGTGLAIAMEAALKFKETCAIQAEAFSGAEVKHGPMALVDEGYPLLVFAPRGPAQAGLLALADEMRQRGGRVLLAAPAGTPSAELPLATTAHEDLDPIAAIQSFYPMVETLARARGFDPDQPRHLAKVTRTR